VTRVFDFEMPDRFVAGAVGEPGGRAFYLQARQGRAVVTVGLEKVQVAALAGRLSQLLDAVDTRFGLETEAPIPEHDDAPLDEPVVELFRATILALAWDVDGEAVVIEAAPGEGDQPGPSDEADVPSEEAEGDELLRVRLTRGRARDFVRRAAALVAAGRPQCPFCGQVLESSGHFCPRTALN